MSVPFKYDEINAYQSLISPTSTNTTCNCLSQYFRRYLILDAISFVKATTPDDWPKNRYLYLLFAYGSVAVFNTDRFGVIYDRPSYSGDNVFYNPSHVVISNPVLRSNKYLQIGRQCEIIQLKPDYSGILDIVCYYADLMALATQTLLTNLQNTKLAYVFMSANQAGAESFKRLFDRIMAGEPAVFVDEAIAGKKAAVATNGKPTPPWMYFSQDLKGNFISQELLEVLRTLKERFDTDVGIPNTNSQKKERMLVDEVNANNVETTAKAALMLETLQDSCERVHALFPSLNRSNLWFEWRFKEVADVAGDASENGPESNSGEV